MSLKKIYAGGRPPYLVDVDISYPHPRLRTKRSKVPLQRGYDTRWQEIAPELIPSFRGSLEEPIRCTSITTWAKSAILIWITAGLPEPPV